MKVALIGVGGLGGALGRGWLGTGMAPADLTLCDVDEARVRAHVPGATGPVTADASAAVRGADVVVVAVKPQDVMGVLDRAGSAVGADATVISVAAGITLKRARDWLGVHGHLVRAMPNVNVEVRASVTALVPESGAPDAAVQRAADLFARVGTVTRLPDEKLLDPATALGASGPAWVALMAEALMDGGVLAGLPRAAAVAMALDMMEGTARHLREKSLHPAQLKDMVTSPAGTTAAGLLALEQGAVRGAIMHAVDAATERARALGKG